MVIMWIMSNVQNVHHCANNVKGVARFEAVTDSMVFIEKKWAPGEKWKLHYKIRYVQGIVGYIVTDCSLKL